MSSEVPHRELLERLAAEEVRYVLVGGLAVGAWGYVRGTEDIDLVPDSEPHNLERLIALLEGLDGRVIVDGDALDPGSVAVFVKAGDKAFVQTRLGQIDVLQGLPQVPRYAELEAAAEDAELEGLTVRVCSLAHLVAMKEAAGRPQDQVDLDALRAAHPEAFADE